MSTSALLAIDQLPSEVATAMREISSRIKSGSIMRELWSNLLNDQQREKLGGDYEKAYRDGDPAAMWVRLHGISHPRAILEIAVAAGLLNDGKYRRLLRKIGTPQSRTEDTIRQAISTRDLVLVEHKKQVFWKGQEIVIPWHKQQRFWNFIWKLSVKARNGRAVDFRDFPNGPDGVSLDYPAKTKSALFKERRFPPDLKKLITSVGDKSQKLNLPPECIQLFPESE